MLKTLVPTYLINKGCGGAQVFLIAKDQRALRSDLREVLETVKCGVPTLHEDAPSRPNAAAAETLSSRSHAERQSTSTRPIEGTASILAAIKELGQDINKIMNAVNVNTIADQSGALLPTPAPSAAVAADAKYPTLPSAVQEANMLQRSARHRAVSQALRNQKTAMQPLGGQTQPLTEPSHGHNIYYVQNLSQQAYGVPPTEPPCSTTGENAKPANVTATVLAVRAASFAHGPGNTTSNMLHTSNTKAARRRRSEPPEIRQRECSVAPNARPAAAWDSVVLVPGCRSPPSYLSSVSHASGVASGQPTLWQSRPQMAKSASWAVALAAAVDNDQENTGDAAAHKT
jgi:hypothetical protein